MMEFHAAITKPESAKTPCLLLGAWDGQKLTEDAKKIDKEIDGLLNRRLKKHELTGADVGQFIVLYDVAGVKAERLVLVKLPESRKANPESIARAFAAALKTLVSQQVTESAMLGVTELAEKGQGYLLARQLLLAADAVTFRTDRLKSKQKAIKRSFNQLTLFSQHESDKSWLKDAVCHAQAITRAVSWTKELANLPGNYCTPSYLAAQAEDMAKRYARTRVTIHQEDQLKAMGMGAFLSVAKGSREPPRLITIEYQGAHESQAPIVLVGKGLTFDAGGISLKPGENMDEMKYDMSGGATVLGVLQAVLDLKLPINLVGVIPATENLPDGNANKPGDIVTSLSGKTIEILNTDAEGRLILCDALTYSEKFKPELVIDIATLTGACVIALGHHTTGLMSNHDPLAAELLAAGRNIGDRAWQLPMGDEYHKQLESPFADLANIGGRPGGAITAACFLSKFTESMKWAHLDIAGTAWTSGKDKGATGRPVPLLCQFLLNRCSLTPKKSS